MFLRSLFIAATLLAALPAGADRRHDDRGNEREDDRRREEKPRREMTLDQALRMVERRYKAQVLSTETRRQGDRTIYRFKLLNKEGKVWWVSVDAAGG